MLLGLTRSIVAFFVLTSGILTAAPMAFCNARAEESSCCEKPKLPTHCDQSNERCPICSQDLCKLEPTKAKLDTESVFAPGIYVLATIVAHQEHVLQHVSADRPLIDTGPVYLLVCAFRI